MKKTLKPQYIIDQTHAREGLAQPKPWHAGVVTEQGEACRLARVTREPASQTFERMHKQVSVWRKHRVSAVARVHLRKNILCFL
jgi:hypothetical protein